MGYFWLKKMLFHKVAGLKIYVEYLRLEPWVAYVLAFSVLVKLIVI